MNFNISAIATFMALALAGHAVAQDTAQAPVPPEAATSGIENVKPSKSWELGLGGTVFQFQRVSLADFNRTDHNYSFDLNLSHAVWGGGIYAARELSQYFYLDLQGSVGFTDKSIDGRTRIAAMGGVGFQYRPFGNRWIEPYLRAGVNYMYKDFAIIYDGSVGPTPDEVKWIMENYHNKNGRDRRHLIPVALGGGVNMWITDGFGIGLQCDYLLMPYRHVANSVQGTARLIWRIGGRSKKPAPVVDVQYVDRVVERVVEREVVREVPVPAESTAADLSLLFSQLYFDFDRADLTPESEKVLDEIASILGRNTDKRFLITGQTDARGSEEYNMDLSRRRAATVVAGLVERGVPQYMLKSRGVGKKISAVPYGADDAVRRGDRKTVIELVSNSDYWDFLP